MGMELEDELDADGGRLDNNLTVEVLLRLPARSLRRLTQVCKSWYRLIGNKKFVRKHLIQHRVDTNSIVFPGSRNICLYKVHEPPVILINYASPLNLNERCHNFFDDFVLAGSVNGILCIYKRKHREPSYCLLVNPAINQCKEIRFRDCSDLMSVSVGLGFDEKEEDLKVIRLIWPMGIEFDTGVEVYSCNTDSWSVRPKAPFEPEYRNCSFIAKGVPYWVGKKTGDKNNVLGGFDPHTEQFSEFVYPDIEPDSLSQVYPVNILDSASAAIYSPGLIPNELVDIHVLEDVGYWTKRQRTGPLWVQLDLLDTIQSFKDSGELVIPGWVRNAFEVTTLLHDVKQNCLLPNMGVDSFGPRWMESYTHSESLMSISGMKPLVIGGSKESDSNARKKAEFDLKKEKRFLDGQGLKIVENQEYSEKNRRKLAESTPGLKKASAEENLSLLNSLMKGYQEDVDNLTKRDADEDRAAKQSDLNPMVVEIQQAQTFLQSLEREKDVALEKTKKKLQSRPTEKLVDDLQKKVKISQGIDSNSIEAEETDLATSGEEMSKLGSLLLDKNRKTEDEVAQLKVWLSEKTALLEAAEGEITELTATVNEQQRLIQKLEDYISKGYTAIDGKGALSGNLDIPELGATEQSEEK